MALAIGSADDQPRSPLVLAHLLPGALTSPDHGLAVVEETLATPAERSALRSGLAPKGQRPEDGSVSGSRPVEVDQYAAALQRVARGDRFECELSDFFANCHDIPFPVGP